MIFCSRILTTNNTLEALPHQKANVPSGQAGWEGAGEAGSLLIQDLDSVCLQAVLEYLSWPAQARERNLHHSLARTLTVPQSSPS